FKDQKKEYPTCRIKITQEPVLSFVIKDIIDYFIKIKSSDEERHLKKRFQEFKAISNPWGNLFHNSNTKTKTKNNYYEEYDNYDTSDSFIDDGKITEDDM
ncbi:12771_t:CDS:2, partial [Dentiscutata erythropus]